MSFGFAFRETMRGTAYMLDAPLDERPMSFTVAVKVNALRRFLQDKVAMIEGEVTIEGIADHRPLTGTLVFRMHDEKRLPYEFFFEDNDGKRYRFRGQKDLSLVSIHDSLTLLPASLYDEHEREVGRATLRCDIRRDFKRLLGSFRLRASLRRVS